VLRSLVCFVAVDSSADDELQPTDVDWEQLLAATFDPADAMFLGPDEMFSLNRNDVLYAQKYAAARTSAAAPPSGERALNDQDLERCANDLDRFVIDLELACANIGQRGDTDTEDRGELPVSNARDHDLDLNIDPNQSYVDNLDQFLEKSSPTCGQIELLNGQGRMGNLDLDEGQPLDYSADDLHCLEPNSSVDEISTENRLQDTEVDLDKRQDSTVPRDLDLNVEEVTEGREQDNSERRVLSDCDPSDLEITNGPEIALSDMANDFSTARHHYPYDPDPEATVV